MIADEESWILERRRTYFADTILPLLGKEIHSGIEDLISCRDYPKKSRLIEDISRFIIDTLREEGLSDSPSDFLLDHGPVIQRKISDPHLRQRNVWVD